MKIVYYPDAQLFLVAKSPLVVNCKVSSLTIGMKEKMTSEVGIGLSGTQVSLAIRLVVVLTFFLPLSLMNPQVVSKSNATASHQEGCLSIPNIVTIKHRSCCVVLQFLSVGVNFCWKKVLSERFQGILSVCLQHEIDHLNGRIIVRRTQ